jgi:hypothetical protein
MAATMSFPGDPGPPRAHTCISRKLYTQFLHDGPNIENGNDEITSSSSSDDDDIGPIQVGASSTCRSRSRPSRLATPPITATRHREATPPSNVNTTLHLQRTQTLPSVSTFLPSSIWKVPFVPRAGRYSGVFDFDDIAEDAYEAATRGVTVDSLEVRGANVKGLVTAFSQLLADAVKEGDFTHLLTPERHFNMYVYLFHYFGGLAEMICQRAQWRCRLNGRRNRSGSHP